MCVAFRQLGAAGANGAKSMEKLSSGQRINKAGDDAAGLSISEKMRGQIRGLNQASRNAQDGISLIQTAEGALNETHAILQRMRELSVQSANDTNEGVDRTAIQNEVDQLVDEVDRIAQKTQFNNKTLLTGTYDTASSGINFQIGANATQSIELTIADMQSAALGTDSGTKLNALKTGQAGALSNHTSAEAAITVVDDAIKQVSAERSSLGALQNRLEHTIDNLDNIVENTTTAESRIRDTDMAEEMVNYSKNNILAQAGQSMLAQANQSNQGVLSLLQ